MDSLFWLACGFATGLLTVMQIQVLTARRDRRREAPPSTESSPTPS